MKLDVVNSHKEEVEGKCGRCTALCCRYIAFGLKKPRNNKDFQKICQYLQYENVLVFLEDGEWYAELKVDCEHLNGIACGTYKTRPRICEAHSNKDCEFDEEDPTSEPHDVAFKTPEELLKYAKKKFKRINFKIKIPEYLTPTFEIDTPDCVEDYDYMRWYFCHKDINGYKDGKKWYVEFKTKPKVKPEHEYHEPLHYDYMFRSDKELEAWCEERRINPIKER